MIQTQFEQELVDLLNKHSCENVSNTTDFILAQFLVSCLQAWNKATRKRDRWYNVHLEPCNSHWINGPTHIRNTRKEKLS
jgi:hypothetical protein